MAQSKPIETHLETIIETGYEILDTLQDDNPQFDSAKNLFSKRSREIEQLKDIEVDKSNFSKKRHEQLRDLFTRVSLVEKSINNVFAKLSLQYSQSMKDLGLQRKAAKSYSRTGVKSKFLDTQING
jgi:hypothetical protein